MRVTSRIAASCIGLALGAGWFAACTADDHPPGLQHGPGDGIAGSGGGFNPMDPDAPPSPDAAGLCGNQVHQAISDIPNLYFVLDASGSMAVPFGDLDRYDTVRVAMVDLVRALGPLIRVGAAVFPAHGEQAPCGAGREVFPVTQGDAVNGEEGPTTQGLRLGTIVDEPIGGTPTGATLEAIRPNLEGLPGQTIVLLATDGGPNCNPDATCTADECMSNIDGVCEPTTNCCAPNGIDGPELCVDRAASVAAVEKLWEVGIPVYVIGIPGSELYGSVLDEMAVAGGKARDENPRYVRVEDLSKLKEVFASIAQVAISCSFTLEDPPAERGKTNVYFDEEVVPYDEDNGWRWESDSVIELTGAQCVRLKSGQVKQVQIVSGCPTEVPK